LPRFRFPSRAAAAALVALAAAALTLAAGSAHACLFAASTPPDKWYEWSQALFAADVTGIEQDARKVNDLVTVRVVEVFKGPDAATATVELPARMWAECRLARPAPGARVLIALNPNGTAMLIPLAADYAERLRALKK
jgi:hypothetical protein